MLLVKIIPCFLLLSNFLEDNWEQLSYKSNYLPGSPRASVIKDAAKVCPVAQAARPVFAG
jgi:hypothetical protein